jgi:exopolysaccharide production protein ExoY
MQGPRPTEQRIHVITDRSLIATVQKANGAAKRWIDGVCAALVLIAIAPALLPLMALLAMDQRTSPIVGARMVGRHGMRFDAWTLRAWRGEGDENEARDTPLARWIAAYGFDRVLLLWNVLCGEMSLVGPRPIARSELDAYQGERRYYLLVRPGFTGLWRLAQTDDVARSAALDKDYLEAWSFKRDAMILWRTLPYVFAAKDQR